MYFGEQLLIARMTQRVILMMVPLPTLRLQEKRSTDAPLPFEPSLLSVNAN
jgi:hypothetical protein